MTIADADVAAAVRNRQVVELTYAGDGLGVRVIHPHVLYRTSTGKQCVDGYQISGPTHSGRLPGWRVFEVLKIERLRILDETFPPAPGYNPSSRKYRHGVLARA